MGLWGLPDSIVEAIYFHHSPGDFPITSLSPLTAVHIANGLETTKSAIEDAPIESYFDMEYLIRLGISDQIPTWQSIRNEIHQKGEDSE